jgi:membrane fusion protein, copper/silver efflux system
MSDRLQSRRRALHLRGGARVALVVALILLPLAGIAAGVRWHAQLGALAGNAPSGGAAAAGEAKQLWTCGMHPQVIQDHPGSCPICGMALTPLAGSTAAQRAGGERRIRYWWDPMMNPPYVSDRPGRSPMGMDLVPVYDDEVAGGATVTIDPVVVQNMGLRVKSVIEAPLARTLRAVGILEEPEPNHLDINLRVGGWIEVLHANVDGMEVREGDPLFELYSPQLQVAIEELIAARKRREAPGSDDAGARERSDALYATVAKKLALLGLDPVDIKGLAQLEQAPPTVTFKSPMTGHVTEKNVYAGAAVQAGERVLRLANRSTMWLELRLFERDLTGVHVGQRIRATLDSLPGESFDGEVSFVHPHLDEATRTGMVRAVLQNASHVLRQGMYATAEIRLELAPRALLVPREAVLDTGERQVVFVALEQGHFEPRKVTLGAQGEGGQVQILSGLAPGETVVVSGQFLLDAESRMQEAIQKFLQPAAAPEGVARAAAGGVPIEAAPEWLAAEDAALAEYLALARSLGLPQASEAALDPSALVAAARSLEKLSQTAEQQALARSLAGTAGALEGQPLASQRKLFKELSEAAIALADRSPPSASVAPQLYVMHCPMVPADWLQASREVQNPYYSSSMKTCGEVRREIPARPQR